MILYSHIRGGGLGNDAFVARVVGLKPKPDRWKIDDVWFDLLFVRKDTTRCSRSMQSGIITWEIETEGMYYYCHFHGRSVYTDGGGRPGDRNFIRAVKAGTVDGFFIFKDGERRHISRRLANRIAASMNSVENLLAPEFSI